MNIKSRNKRDANFSMSSMTDIIFLLLIFFMLTSSMVVPNPLGLEIPQSNEQAPATTPRVAVSIDKDLNYFIGTTLVSSDELGVLLRAEIAKSSEPENATVMLYTNKKVPTKNVAQVMKIANDLKIKMILATLKK